MSADPDAIARLLRSSAATGWTVTATGQSMHPRIPAGSRLHVTARDELPKLGEVWVFVTSGNDVTAHRFLRCARGGRLLFFGDAAPACDAPVEPARLIGRVGAIETDSGVRSPRRSEAIIPVTRIVVREIRRRLAVVRSRSRN